MRETSQKKVIKHLENGMKLESLQQFSRTLFYLTNYKDTEITVPEKTVNKLIEKEIIDSNLDFRPKNKQ